MQSSVPHAFSTAYGQRWHTTIFMSSILVLFTLLRVLSPLSSIRLSIAIIRVDKMEVDAEFGRRENSSKSGSRNLGSSGPENPIPTFQTISLAILRKSQPNCARCTRLGVAVIHRDRTRECNKLRSGFTCAFWIWVCCVFDVALMLLDMK